MRYEIAGVSCVMCCVIEIKKKIYDLLVKRAKEKGMSTSGYIAYLIRL